MGSSISIYDLQDSNEVLYMVYERNGTIHYMEDDYYTMNFLLEKVKIETTNFNGRGFRKILEEIIKQGVITKEGKINAEKLEIFYNKYDESITDRTVIHR